jgi:hypothetical protein
MDGEIEARRVSATVIVVGPITAALALMIPRIVWSKE